jgi:hypothetical protein
MPDPSEAEGDLRFPVLALKGHSRLAGVLTPANNFTHQFWKPINAAKPRSNPRLEA